MDVKKKSGQGPLPKVNAIPGGEVWHSWWFARRRVVQTMEKSVVIGIAMGYPDMEAPVNQFPRSRAPLEEYVTFVK